MNSRAYLLFALLWTTLVYDPLAHWVWGDGGWLHTLGALDFAGGTVVHISAGTSALVAAIMLGKRRDFGRAPLVPHNVPFTLLGAGLLWFGWFGFNAGSALAANGVAANAFVTTHTAAAAALTMWMLLDLFRTGTATAVGAATGAVVGLVAITPAAGFVTPRAAIAIGVIARVGELRRDAAPRAHAARRRARRVRLSRRRRHRRRAAHGRVRDEGRERGRRPMGCSRGTRTSSRCSSTRCWRRSCSRA